MRISDWSSDVCSSDLKGREEVKRSGGDVDRHFHPAGEEHRLFARPIRTQNLVLRQRPDKLAPVARAQKREHRRRTEAACKPGTHCSPDEPFIKEAISRERADLPLGKIEYADLRQGRGHLQIALLGERSEEHTSDLQSL